MTEKELQVKRPKKFIGVRFGCCDKYTRIYINKDSTAYEGSCPECFRHIRIRIGKDGTDCRFFVVH